MFRQRIAGFQFVVRGQSDGERPGDRGKCIGLIDGIDRHCLDRDPELFLDRFQHPEHFLRIGSGNIEQDRAFQFPCGNG